MFEFGQLASAESHAAVSGPCIKSPVRLVASCPQALAADLEAASAQSSAAVTAQDAAASALRDALLLQDEDFTRSLQLQVNKVAR